MVTQAPKRSAVLIAVTFALSCVGLIIFVWTQFGGTIPFAPQGYRVQALFKETGLLVPNADVRISGVNIGKVSSVQARGLNSLVTMDIQHQFAPIPADTQAILRQKTLLGEAYVELSTGNVDGTKLPDGGTIPTSHIQDTQQLDQVLGSFDKTTQHNLQLLLNGSGEALAGRGQALNDAIGNLDPLVTELAAVVGELNQQQGNLRTLISDGGTVLNALGSHSNDLQTIVTAGDQVLSTTAAENAALTSTVNSLPPFLAGLRTTLTTLNGTLGIAKPSIAALKPAAPLLAPALADLTQLSGPLLSLLQQAPPVLQAAKVALPALARFNRAFKPATDAILPAAQQIVPVINLVAVYRRELLAAMGNLAADLEAKAIADIPSGRASYLRAITTLGRESLYGQTTREPTGRNNTYFSPGELSNLGSGALLSASCSNTGNSSTFPIPFGNVSCRLQPSFPWPSGIARSYYPHVTQSPK